MHLSLILILQSASAIATIVIAVYVARISQRQWRTNQEKLRLELYDRRFDIFCRVIDYYQALLEWEGNPQQLSLRGPFVKAVRESRFLFPKDSGVLAFLEEFQRHSFFIVGYEENRKAYERMPKLLVEFAQKRLGHVNWVLNSMADLENKIASFLNFHSM